MPAADVKEFIAHAKANPGALNMGTGSPTTYIRNATFMQGTNTHVAGFQWVNDERVLISLAEKFAEEAFPHDVEN